MAADLVGFGRSPGPVAAAQAAKTAQLQGGRGNVASIPAFQLAGEDPDADLYPAR